MDIKKILYRPYEFGSSNLKIRLAQAILLTILQVLFFIFTHEAGYRLYERFWGKAEPDLSWGIYVQFAMYFFSATVIIAGSLSLFLSKWPTAIYLGMSFLVFTIFLIGQLSYRPYRSVLLILSSVIGIFLPYILLERVTRRRGR